MRRAVLVLGVGLCGFVACLALAQCSPQPSQLEAASPRTPAALDSAKSSGYVLVLSDLHFNPIADGLDAGALDAKDAGSWEPQLAAGSTGFAPDEEDANYFLLRAVLDQARVTLPAPDFVVVTGDLLWHHLDASFASDKREAIAEDVVAFLARQISNRFPSTPIFPVLGNNDTASGDYHGPSAQFLQSMAAHWAPLVRRAGVESDFETSFPERAYYTATIPGRRAMRIVGLDSVLWSPRHVGCDASAELQQPAKDEIAWLSKTLDGVRARGQVTWLLSHIPPGVDAFDATRNNVRLMYCPEYQRAFLATVGEHADVVPFAVASHTHTSDYRLYHFDAGPTVPQILAPSIGPNHHNNPAFTVLRYDRDTGAVLDVTSYALDLARAREGRGISWRVSGDFDESYGQADGSVADFSKAMATIGADASACAAYVTTFNGGRGPSIASQWRAYHCGTEHLFADDFAQCYGDGAPAFDCVSHEGASH